MRMDTARRIIGGERLRPGYMVSFEHLRGGILESDHFPDVAVGEPLIATEDEAWLLAAQFAEKTKGECVNIYVIDADFRPVPGWSGKKIKNR